MASPATGQAQAGARGREPPAGIKDRGGHRRAAAGGRGTIVPNRMKLRLLTLAATLALAAPAAAAQDPQLIARENLSPRLQELTFKTSALAAPTKVRILL